MNRQALREGRGVRESQAPSIVRDVVRSPGHALEPRTRASMESHFGRDFSGVRVHADERAARSADAMNARAYTVGNHIAFGRGVGDRGLLEHELTHVVQQAASGERSVQCASVCDQWDFGATKSTIDAKLTMYKVDTKNMEAKKESIRWVKVLRKCGKPEQWKEVEPKVPVDIWKAAGTAFGGYTVLRPGYAGDLTTAAKGLGATETLATGTFESKYQEAEKAGRPFTNEDMAEQRGRSKRAAASTLDELARTDIVYFRGHHFGRHEAPGVFTNNDYSVGFDARYIKKAGGFENVKLMISTSCTTLCRQSLDIYRTLFPKAKIFGYAGGAPENGKAVRDAFNKSVEAKGTMLLTEEADVSSLISAWKAAVVAENKDNDRPKPGYYDGTTLHYWSGKEWLTAEGETIPKCPSIPDSFKKEFPAPAASGP
jgi:hypothetical protein